MSHAQPFEQAVAVASGPHRSVEQRVAVRLPAAMAVFGRAVSRLPPRSPVRRVLLRRLVVGGVEALNRGDHAAAFALWHRHSLSTFPAEMTALGDDPEARGRAGRIEFQRRWMAGWGTIAFMPS